MSFYHHVSQSGISNRDLEVLAEDEQQFLMRQQQYLQQGGAPPSAANSGASAAALASVQKSAERKSMGSPGVQGSPKKVIYFTKIVS